MWLIPPLLYSLVKYILPIFICIIVSISMAYKHLINQMDLWRNGSASNFHTINFNNIYIILTKSKHKPPNHFIKKIVLIKKIKWRKKHEQDSHDYIKKRFSILHYLHMYTSTTTWFKFFQLMLCTKNEPIDGGINTKAYLYIYIK